MNPSMMSSRDYRITYSRSWKSIKRLRKRQSMPKRKLARKGSGLHSIWKKKLWICKMRLCSK